MHTYNGQSTALGMSERSLSHSTWPHSNSERGTPNPASSVLVSGPLQISGGRSELRFVTSHWKDCFHFLFSLLLYFQRTSCGPQTLFWWHSENLRVPGYELAKDTPFNNMYCTAAWQDLAPISELQKQTKLAKKVSYFTTPEYFKTSYSFTPNLALLKSNLTVDKQKASHSLGIPTFCHQPEEAHVVANLLEKRKGGQSWVSRPCQSCSGASTLWPPCLGPM